MTGEGRYKMELLQLSSPSTNGRLSERSLRALSKASSKVLWQYD
jgi:hypothetical protein